jgi:recombination protein RecR
LGILNGMVSLPKSVQACIDGFARLPGIGPKMASRLTFFLLQKSEYEVARFVDVLDGIRSGLTTCTKCGYISEAEVCPICLDTNRNQQKICVVEGPLDVVAIERTDAYTGLYHVLGGALSPLDGIGPAQLRINLLEQRVRACQFDSPLELIIATNPSLEGEATASYLTQQFSDSVAEGRLVITRIARGLPMGSDLEYADPTTLLRAMEGRKSIHN